jgi:hypothetical protein
VTFGKELLLTLLALSGPKNTILSSEGNFMAFSFLSCRMTLGGTVEKPSKVDASSPKKPYEKPSFRCEQVFETAALCSKVGVQPLYTLKRKTA